ncbi:hypothetical protein E2320_022092, partial [Naja naja]
LHRYKHPSEEELLALAGKQKPKGKRDSRRINGVTDGKPSTVPRDIDLQLESSPIRTVDALVLCYFLEYQWYVDFAGYSTLVYLFTEGYYCLVEPQKETNIGILWCLLTAVFSVKIFVMVMRHYFRSKEGGERSVCLSFAFLFLLIAMVVLVVREDYLEFGLNAGLTSVHNNLEVFFMDQGWEWMIPVTKLGIKVGLVAICSFIGACLTFPGLRLAQTQLDALKMVANQPKIQLLLHASFLAPVIVVLMWIKPIARDLLLQAPMGKETVQIFNSSEYSWGLYPEPALTSPAPDAIPVRQAASSEDSGKEDIQAAVEQITASLSALGTVFTPLFYRGLFSFCVWWIAACQVISIFFGLYFHQHLAIS